MKKIISLVLLVTMLVCVSNCAVYAENTSTYTADELAYVAYKDIDRAYFSCLNYMKHMDRLWSSLLDVNSIDEIDDDWMFGSYLFGSDDQTELFQRYYFLSNMAKVKLGMDEDMSFSDHIKATGRNIVIDAIQESASTNALTDPRDVMWLLLAWGEEAGCMTSMAEIELYLQYAKDEIETIMNEDSNYANTVTLREYYAETSALYSYLNDFIDTYEALRYQTQCACRDAGVAYRGEHIFRHTFATNCYYKGMDVKILSKLLGHADVNITYNIYVHLYGDGFEEMYSALVR